MTAIFRSMTAIRSITFARRVFLIAGIYGLIVLLPQNFLEAKTSRDFPPAITHVEYYYGFIGVAVAWQVAFLVVSRDPVRYRPIMIAAILEKASWGIATVVLFVAGRLSGQMMAGGAVDVLLGVLFVVAFAQTPSAEPDV
jgi:hypothetical protein